MTHAESGSGMLRRVSLEKALSPSKQQPTHGLSALAAKGQTESDLREPLSHPSFLRTPILAVLYLEVQDDIGSK